MKIQKKLTFLILSIVLSSCCTGSKEDYLGNNIYFSEYDNIDKRILYQTESCSVSGIEIVPMTVLEISHNDKWIIAKSGDIRRKNNFKFWIIKNQYKNIPEAETVKQNVIEFTNQENFEKFLSTNKIGLKLTKT